MTHRGPFQPLLFCDSVILLIVSSSQAKAQILRPIGKSSFYLKKNKPKNNNQNQTSLTILCVWKT